MLDNKIVEDVRKKLEKNPIVYESVRLQIEDYNRTLKLVGKTELGAPKTDFVTYIGASDAQKKICGDLIKEYGADIMSLAMVQIYYGGKKDEDWREKMK